MNSVDPILDAWRSLVHRREPDALVLGNGRSSSIGDIERLAQIAQVDLDRHGLSGQLVALSAANGPGFFAAVLALRRLGCVVLLVDWTIKQEERARIRDGLGAAAFVAVTQTWPAKTSWLDVDPASECGLAALPVGADFLKLTSGSTGEPRGVAISSEALCADDRGIVKSMGIRPDDRILAAIPVTHSYGFSSIALPALLRGTSIIVPGSGPLSAMKATRQHDVTFLPTVPAYVESLVKASRPPKAPSSLRLVITAGAQLKPSAARAFREIYGQPVHVFYGASECGGICFDQSGSAGEQGTLGTPIDGVTLTLAPLSHPSTPLAPIAASEPTSDPESSTISQPGRVVVQSAAVALSYFPHSDPCLQGGRFETSDLAQFAPSGELILQGRIDSVINVKVKKIQPAEIETLLRSMPGIEDVVVMPFQDPKAGAVIRAVVVKSRDTVGDSLNEQQVRRFCRERLAEYKVPRSIVVVRELPLTARGKLDRRLLRQAEFDPDLSQQAHFEG